MATITPPTISESIIRLCSKIAPSAHPVYVPVRPEYDADTDDCFLNVRRKIARDSGTILHGWQIWEWVGVLVEAEFHAIWVSPDGELVDITPKQNSEERVLLLADEQKKWNGSYIDNVRLPLISSQLFKDLEAVSKRLIYEYNRGKRISEGVMLDPMVAVPLGQLKHVCWV